ncbi:MAG TPA: 4'-phosphopantetheinyl transferase superfamily protein [Pyrinomonadaceae bacterium]|nr:4'-phosphopantetheinyl transferase superfamily protein [Pyrinomonadaceae bacterium]
MDNYSTEDPAETIRVTDLADAASLIPRLKLGADEVHVWLADLNQPAEKLKPLLAADEIARAERFHFEKDRKHYIVARALLRKLLAVYLRTTAAEVRFDYTEKGKPSLEGVQNNLLNFNLAHSHGKALYAFSRGRKLGIDLEFIREDFGGQEIAERFFSQSEIAALGNVPSGLSKQAFFNCWTRKEAYIKARGEGLSMPLDVFDVSLAPGEAAALLRNHKEPAEVARWSMQSVCVPLGYVAALVVEGHSWNLKRFKIDSVV